MAILRASTQHLQCDSRRNVTIDKNALPPNGRPVDSRTITSHIPFHLVTIRSIYCTSGVAAPPTIIAAELCKEPHAGYANITNFGA
ncbi:hypothetical protein SCLCIDRAFT_1216968 [Scleroderma citrinum Foug A]|uniref:Uncharacterized protein n=1 Tax=Scleroderma citrinum Foug A TaxID=1036808 RepID=A0A0C2ZEQ6_9AGAM|nr:hypothetical protein SCLCIDRAFT_1216968 [Scleroderma citrinum Foug A]